MENDYDSVGPLFTASFNNREDCECGAELLEGDKVGYLDGVLSCEECVTAAQTEKTSNFTKRWNETKK